MKTVTFYTPTMLPKACIFTMGVSVKETANPIGEFGTGLKYAISVILRLGGKIDLAYCDAATPKEFTIYKFSVKQEDIRGKAFGIIYCNDERMPVSTEYGKKWEPWMALRELESNTRDEGGESWAGERTHHIVGTYITVECAEFYDAWLQRDKYFLNKERAPLWENGSVAVYSGESDTFFYRGIAVGQKGFKSRLTYNVKTAMYGLTEDRTMSDGQIKHYSVHHLVDCDIPNVVNRLIDYNPDVNGYVEDEMSWPELNERENKVFLEILHDKYRKSIHLLNDKMINALTPYLRSNHIDERWKPVALVKRDEERFAACIDMLKHAGFNFDNMTISFADTGEALGLASFPQRRIIINRDKCLRADDWMDVTTRTLIEEYVHIKYNVLDESRGFQEACTKIIYHLAKNGKVDES